MKTLDIHAKEWFDKVNGNSYFAATVIIDLGFDSEKVIKIPFTYGYGDSYLYAAFKELKSAGLIIDGEKYDCPWKYCNDRKIVFRYSKQENCLKRELKNI